MASKAGTLDVVLASAVHKDMVAMVREEEILREKAKKMVGLCPILKTSLQHYTVYCVHVSS